MRASRNGQLQYGQPQWLAQGKRVSFWTTVNDGMNSSPLGAAVARRPRPHRHGRNLSNGFPLRPVTRSRPLGRPWSGDVVGQKIVDNHAVHLKDALAASALTDRDPSGRKAGSE
jgi:hypothetical protein